MNAVALYRGALDKALHDPARQLIGTPSFALEGQLIKSALKTSDGNNWVRAPDQPKILKIAPKSQDNVVVIGEVERGLVRPIDIHGSRNFVYIGSSIKSSPRITIVGNDNIVFLSNEVTVNDTAFVIKGEGRSIIAGRDCMFSRGITVRASDSHGIFSIEDEKIVNAPESVIFHPHVWVGENVSVLKGVEIGMGSVIGAGSVVTSTIPARSLAIGTPARVVKSGVSWTRSENPSSSEISRVIALLDRLTPD